MITKETVLQLILPSTELFNLAKDLIKCETEENVKRILTTTSDYAAMLLFTKLTNLFVFEYKLATRSCRYKKAVYLLVDELDLLAQCSAKEAREVNDLIRHLYDACPDCFCMTLAFTATSAELGVLFATTFCIDIPSRLSDFLQPDEAKYLFEKFRYSTQR